LCYTHRRRHIWRCELLIHSMSPVDLRSEYSPDIVSNSETNTPASLSSPHEDNARLHSFSVLDQGNPTGRVADLLIGTGSLCTQPVHPELHAPYSAHIRRRRATLDSPPLGRSGSEFGTSWQSPATHTRALTVAPHKPRRNLPSILPNSTIESPYDSPVVSDSRQAGASPSPNFRSGGDE
jgi:hypothetical protein